jgi:hypothetical protein
MKKLLIRLAPYLSVPWPALETLTVFQLFYSEEYNEELVEILCELTDIRIERGCPLDKARLDENSWFVLLAETCREVENAGGS